MITCKFENGNDASLRHVVVDAIVLNAARDSILLVKRAPHLTNGGKYGLIGGFLDRDETIEQAMIRELMEETGYEGIILKRFQIIDSPDRKNEDRQNVTFVFLVEAGQQTGVADNESTEVRWFKFTELPNESEFAFDHFDSVSAYLQTVTV
ncbi:NUDIX hydrolase [Candidatus Microgenomates bacterium]|nr:NUDIX hydrolase [Candidatus Microgenomates bacterium]